MLQPPGIVESSNPTRLEPRRVLAQMGRTERDNPDDTPLHEAVSLIRRFKQDSTNSDLRQKAMLWWKTSDSFVEGDQWGEPGKDGNHGLKPWQARLTINKLT